MLEVHCQVEMVEIFFLKSNKPFSLSFVQKMGVGRARVQQLCRGLEVGNGAIRL